jgi:phosphatidylglycerophosphate synthase
MLDGVMRRWIDPPLDWLGRRLAASGVSANAVTLAGAVAAIACGVAIACAAPLLALGFLVLSRLADGLDGAIARASTRSDFGGFLDIVCDFVFYAAVPLGFVVLDPTGHAVAAAVLLASFYVNAASFLGFAIMAAKRGMTTQVRGAKSLYFTTGLAEGTETIAVFVAMVLWPAGFAVLAYGFALLCFVTAIARVGLAWQTFRPDPTP